MDPPFSAFDYTNDKQPFVFVSYAHTDAQQIYPIIKQLHEKGVRIWYDEGIEASSEWMEKIADAIEHCTTFITFLSNASIQRNNVKREIAFALKRYDNNELQFIPVYLEEMKLSKELDLALGPIQALMKHKLNDIVFFAKLYTSIIGVAAKVELSPQTINDDTKKKWEEEIARRLKEIENNSKLTDAQKRIAIMKEKIKIGQEKEKRQLDYQKQYGERRVQQRRDGNIMPKTTSEELKSNKDHTKYDFNGETRMPKNRLVLAVVKKYIRRYPNTTFKELSEVFPPHFRETYGVFKTLQEVEMSPDPDRFFRKDSDIIHLKDQDIAVCNQWGGDYFLRFVHYARNKLGFEITEAQEENP